MYPYHGRIVLSVLHICWSEITHLLNCMLELCHLPLSLHPKHNQVHNKNSNQYYSWVCVATEGKTALSALYIVFCITNLVSFPSKIHYLWWQSRKGKKLVQKVYDMTHSLQVICQKHFLKILYGTENKACDILLHNPVLNIII